MPGRIDPSLIPASPDISIESALWSNQIALVAGLDEAGRGAWAGPVVAAAVVLPQNPEIEHKLKGVRDSKELTPAKRVEMASMIQQHALAYAVGQADNEEIDQMGILPATRLAMAWALAGLALTPDHLLIDALFLPEIDIPQTSLIKGDQRSMSIAAASILAKTTRDALMTQYHTDYSAYGFERHKGYGTRLHQQRLAEHGPCSLHRMSYAPLQENKSKTPKR